jgi:hypothetical protein
MRSLEFANAVPMVPPGAHGSAATALERKEKSCRQHLLLNKNATDSTEIKISAIREIWGIGGVFILL